MDSTSQRSIEARPESLGRGILLCMRCIHCLKEVDKITDDHVFPSSWFPNGTSGVVQRWTVPSCWDCNNELSKKEEDLLARLAICLHPDQVAGFGLADKVLRSFGVGSADPEKLGEKEMVIREKKRQKFVEEINSFSGPINPIAKVDDDRIIKRGPAIPIDGALMLAVYEKVIRGCEYTLNNHRYVEVPYRIQIFGQKVKKEFEETFKDFPTTRELGPGFKITRIIAAEDSLTVIYNITLWDTFRIYAMVTFFKEPEDR